MPSADHALLDFDELQAKPKPSTAPAVSLETDDFPTITTKKVKKAKKSKKNAAQAKPKSDDAEDSPTHHDVLSTSPANSDHSQPLDIVLDPHPMSPREHGVTVDAVPGLTDAGVTLIDTENHPEAIPPQGVTHVREPESQTTTLAEASVEPDRPIALPTPHHDLEKRGSESLIDSPQREPTRPVATSPQIKSSTMNGSPPSTKPNATRPRPFQPFASAQPPRHEQYQSSYPRHNPLEAPAPHKAQSHFFSLPDLGLNLAAKQEPGKIAGSDGCCCCFDTFAECGELTAAKRAKDVLLVGSEGGLDVYRVVSDKIEVIGRLEGLRGAVIGAKALPQPAHSDFLAVSRPLVALTIHGPASEDAASSVRSRDSSSHPSQMSQTTVEVYSISTQQHIATLYRGVPVPEQARSLGQPVSIPRPADAFTLDANGNFILLASAKSGEIWLFSNPAQSDSASAFRCLGKVWTALQIRSEPGRPAQSPEQTAVDLPMHSRQPLYSLGNRWLAIVPPYTSAGTAIQGSPALLDNEFIPPGLSTQLAPIQPLVTCEVAGTDAEGTLSWLSRKAAQGLVKASQRGYEMGLQGWRELTSPSPPNAAPMPLQNRGPELFPPTNAPADDPKRLAKEPALISIIDLQTLANNVELRLPQMTAPLATFALLEGCNHISFSPDGLRLLTTNRKGEASTVWDLQNIAHGKAKFDADHASAFEKGPHVRQIHRMVRSSPSTVLESMWPRDGDKVALLTTHGTIHLHEIPLRPSGKRRRRKSAFGHAATEKAEPTVGVSQGMSPPSSNSFWNTVRTGMQSVGAHVNAIRSQSTGLPTTFAGFREATAAAGQAGGRAVAKGLSHGYTAAKGGASDIWHAEDNKIRQKALQDVAGGKGYLRWMHRKGETFLAVVCNGVVHLYPVQQEVRRKGNMDVTGLRKFSPRNFTLPRIAVQDVSETCADQGPHGFWILQPADQTRFKKADRGNTRAQATEVESSPPYCPFHIDARVSIFAFDDGPNASQVYDGDGLPWHLKGHGVADEAPWTFGEPLPPSTRMNEHAGHDIDDREFSFQSASMDQIRHQVESKLTICAVGQGISADEHIRVNTRPSRGREADGESMRFGIVDEDDDEPSTARDIHALH